MVVVAVTTTRYDNILNHLLCFQAGVTVSAPCRHHGDGCLQLVAECEMSRPVCEVAKPSPRCGATCSQLPPLIETQIALFYTRNLILYNL